MLTVVGVVARSTEAETLLRVAACKLARSLLCLHPHRPCLPPRMETLKTWSRHCPSQLWAGQMSVSGATGRMVCVCVCVKTQNVGEWCHKVNVWCVCRVCKCVRDVHAICHDVSVCALGVRALGVVCGQYTRILYDRPTCDVSDTPQPLLNILLVYNKPHDTYL